ncbi:MAG: HAMP domain-containing histidine kinase [Alphaproteobacteria bacterium]|nr:HAMP domain-containing histidine kinase [Alphaproteobacteria bacterium]
MDVITVSGRLEARTAVKPRLAVICPDGEDTERFSILRDRIRQLEHELAEERRRCDLQEKYIAMATHELRNPLAAIHGTAQRVMRTTNDEDTVKRMGKIRTTIMRMNALIDKTLYLSRLSADTLEMNSRLNDFRAILETAVAIQSEITPGHAIHLEFTQDPGEIICDSVLMEHVFTNLFSNAIKYSPDSPHIEVAVGIRHGFLVTTVCDFGIGIPERDRPNLFRRFMRASNAVDFRGTGIGLSICKEIVDLHGGAIGVESVEDEGTTVTVWLPI